MGTFQISGPFTAAHECVVTTACTLQIGGVGLASSNKVRVISSTASCGANALPFISGWAEGVQVTDSSPYRTYNLGTNTAGSAGDNIASLCWGHAPGTNVLQYSFTVSLATLSIHGPYAQDKTCILTVGLTSGLKWAQQYLLWEPLF